MGFVAGVGPTVAVLVAPNCCEGLYLVSDVLLDVSAVPIDSFTHDSGVFSGVRSSTSVSATRGVFCPPFVADSSVDVGMIVGLVTIAGCGVVFGAGLMAPHILKCFRVRESTSLSDTFPEV
ncbi:unnamed protein product [Meganyctiphanes norvegica]|uniref:Uncharacterized protein n=1 Tax=Meganyctiphanes norvegica TaxID=48144 RepID=A0AAV2QKJ2_MEGNR